MVLYYSESMSRALTRLAPAAAAAHDSPTPRTLRGRRARAWARAPQKTAPRARLRSARARDRRLRPHVSVVDIHSQPRSGGIAPLRRYSHASAVDSPRFGDTAPELRPHQRNSTAPADVPSILPSIQPSIQPANCPRYCPAFTPRRARSTCAHFIAPTIALPPPIIM